MEIKIRESGDVSILDIEGRIDIDSAEFIETAGWLLKNNKLKILCNFENVELVDYSGLSILAIAYKNIVNHNGVMKFCNVGLHIKELLKVAQMDRVFASYDDEKDALASFDDSALELEQKPLRRRFKRLETNVSVEFKPAKNKNTQETPRTGKVLNLSGAGLFIYTHDIFPIRTLLDLEIILPKELAPLEMDGMVIWIADRNLQGYCYPGMGVQFINVDAERQKELLDFIEKNVTHRSEA